MKAYLILLLVALGHSLTYRLLLKHSLPFTTTPDSISYLNPTTLVTQTGSNIVLYSTKDYQPVQNYTAEGDNPQIQISSSMLLFKNNGSIYQLQKPT